jgi:hypothetical protein
LTKDWLRCNYWKSPRSHWYDPTESVSNVINSQLCYFYYSQQIKRECRTNISRQNFHWECCPTPAHSNTLSKCRNYNREYIPWPWEGPFNFLVVCTVPFHISYLPSQRFLSFSPLLFSCLWLVIFLALHLCNRQSPQLNPFSVHLHVISSTLKKEELKSSETSLQSHEPKRAVFRVTVNLHNHIQVIYIVTI